jgi:drug/metabolite transporter (DMT)-like permease
MEQSNIPSMKIPDHRDRRRGLLYGLLGVASFSLTLPATRVAVTGLDPVFVGLGRAVIAAALAAIVLVITRTPWPGRAYLPGLAMVGGGVVVGFPLFSALAMRHVPASHGAVVIGILPLATAIAAAALAHERPSRRFWISAAFGSAVVIGFAFEQGGGAPQAADGLLALAAGAAAIGYAEGGRLARTIGGWQVICWALVIASPFVLVPTLLAADARLATASAAAWAGFAYVSVVSMFLGFFAWYRGLALGGIAAVGQVQLLQPFLTIFASAFLLGETVGVATFVAAVLVIASIALGRRS